MTFVSLTFVAFLFIVFTLYWSFPNRTAQNVVLIVASYVFYGWWDYRYLTLIIISSLVDYSAGRSLERVVSRRARRAVLLVSVCTNLGLLGIFKYFNFFAESFAELVALFGWRASPFMLNVVLPVGISFYTFQTMSYTIDIYNGRLRGRRNLIDYLAYVAFFPQLVAGPIERAGSLLVQMERPHTFVYDDAVNGCRQILWGYFKKIVIADRAAVFVDQCYGHIGTTTGPQFWAATVAFAVQIYCDFSGYSDIAIGTASLFGFHLRRNFAYPYFSQSVTEFWRRWHMSLSSWFRDYVYIPLGGNRVPLSRQLGNVLLTFALCGLWHGASWNFILWGALHGVYLCAERLWMRPRALGPDDPPGGPRFVPKASALLAMGRTFFLVLVAWVFFRAQNLGEACSILTKMATEIWHSSAYEGFGTFIKGDYLWLLAVFVVIEWLSRAKRHPFMSTRIPLALRWAAYTFVIWLCLYVCPDKQMTFIYFQF